MLYADREENMLYGNLLVNGSAMDDTKVLEKGEVDKVPCVALDHQVASDLVNCLQNRQLLHLQSTYIAMSVPIRSNTDDHKLFE